MTTVRDICFEALLMLGVIDGEGPIEATEAQGALRVLNTLVDSWALEDLLIYVTDRQVFPLAAGVQTVTIGPGGTYNTTPLYSVTTSRPVLMQSVSWQDPATGLELPLAEMSEEEYTGLLLRVLDSSMPLQFHYRAAFPLGELFFWPRPTVPANVVLWLGHPWDKGMTLDTVVTLPPGYQRMMESNLALELSFRYPGTTPPTALADDAKRRVKGLNQQQVPRMATDVPSAHRGSGDMYAWTGFLAGRG